jgi:hypothetical protein
VNAALHHAPFGCQSKDVEGKWEAKAEDFVLLRPDFEQEPNALFWLARVVGYEKSDDGIKNYLLQYYEPQPHQDPVTCMWHPNAQQRMARCIYVDWSFHRIINH